MAPEIVKKGEYDPTTTDVWAVGILCYRLLYGQPPFRGQTEKELYTKIVRGKYSFPAEPQTSQEVKELINSMLQY